jgi:hypothetical protein
MKKFSAGDKVVIRTDTPYGELPAEVTHYAIPKMRVRSLQGVCYVCPDSVLTDAKAFERAAKNEARLKQNTMIFASR